MIRKDNYFYCGDVNDNDNYADNDNDDDDYVDAMDGDDDDNDEDADERGLCSTPPRYPQMPKAQISSLASSHRGGVRRRMTMMILLTMMTMTMMMMLKFSTQQVRG